MSYHASRAEDLALESRRFNTGSPGQDITAGLFMLEAQVQATLALVEQQRIANLTAFVGSLARLTATSMLADAVVDQIIDEIGVQLGIEEFVKRAVGLD